MATLNFFTLMLNAGSELRAIHLPAAEVSTENSVGQASCLSGRAAFQAATLLTRERQAGCPPYLTGWKPVLLLRAMRQQEGHQVVKVLRLQCVAEI